MPVSIIRGFGIYYVFENQIVCHSASKVRFYVWKSILNKKETSHVDSMIAFSDPKYQFHFSFYV